MALQCRLDPPAVGAQFGQLVTVFPQVTVEMWCSHWEPEC
jgi:hypothetical protein